MKVATIWFIILLAVGSQQRTALASPVLRSDCMDPKADTITIGILIETKESGKNTVLAAQMAINNHNRLNNPASNRYQLAVKITTGPWGQAGSRTVNLIYQEGAVAIVGSLNGRTAHLAEQVAARSHIPYLETRAMDPTLSKAFLPWFFRFVPDADQIGQALALHIYGHSPESKVAVIGDASYDGVKAVASFKKAIAELQTTPAAYFTLENTATGLTSLIAELQSGNYEAIVVLTDLIDSVVLTEATGAVLYFSHSQNNRRSASLTRQVLTLSVIANQQKYEQLAARLQAHSAAPLTSEGVYMYDAINLLIEAIEEKGATTQAISDYFHGMDGYEGITGTISFVSSGNLKRPVTFTETK